jgi:hypothetical protein
MESREEWVRRRAYELWNDDGRPANRELAHWTLASALFYVETGMGGRAVSGCGARSGAPAITSGNSDDRAGDGAWAGRGQVSGADNVVWFRRRSDQ